MRANSCVVVASLLNVRIKVMSVPLLVVTVVLFWGIPCVSAQTQAAFPMTAAPAQQIPQELQSLRTELEKVNAG